MMLTPDQLLARINELEIENKRLSDLADRKTAQKVHAVDELRSLQYSILDSLNSAIEDLSLIDSALDRESPKIHIALHKSDVIKNDTLINLVNKINNDIKNSDYK